MHHYQHHLGDYAKDTMHLSPLEHGVYRLLMDAYYATEKPIPLDINSACRIARCSTDHERAAVESVLAQFFTRNPDGFRQKRIDEELEAYWHKAQVNAENGKLGGRPKKPQKNPEKTQSVSGGIANQNPQETLTSNHKPVTNTKPLRASRLEADWKLPEDWEAWALAERPGWSRAWVLQTAQTFRDYWIAKPGAAGTKLDWQATWRNWVRNSKDPGLKPSPADPPWKGAM